MSPAPYKSPGNIGNVILDHFCRAVASHPEENRIAQWLYKKQLANEPRDLCVLCVCGWNISVSGVAPECLQPEGRDWVEGYKRVWVLLNAEISFTAIAQQVTMEMEVYQTLSLSHWWIRPIRLTDSNRKTKQQRKTTYIKGCLGFQQVM